MESVCPICGAGQVKRISRSVESTYGGERGVVPQHFHLCDACGSDYADANDMRENRRSIVRFRKAIDGIPMGCEIRAMRLRSGLKQAELAQLVGGGEVAFSKYEADDLIPREGTVNLLRMLIAFPDTIDRLKALAGKQVRISMYGVLAEAFEGDGWEAADSPTPTGTTAAALSTSGMSIYSKEPAWQM